MFRSQFAETIFNQKYAHEGCETWAELSETLIRDVCTGLMPLDEIDQLIEYHTEMKVIFGGRYLYYAGRSSKFFNNCYLLRAEEDTREDWADLSWKAESCLMTGGGIGIDYSRYRPSGSRLNRTGGTASGPLPKMEMINEIGRRVMQGGARRSALYASLNWQHGDIQRFLTVKDWHNIKVPGTDLSLWDLKQLDFNWPAPLDMTNISVNYDTAWLNEMVAYGLDEVFLANVRQALLTGEPGFSFNFYAKENETLRNACTEVASHQRGDYKRADKGLLPRRLIGAHSLESWGYRLGILKMSTMPAAQS
jgi:ribonucleoside-diphosphate reductase alpha chain